MLKSHKVATRRRWLSAALVAFAAWLPAWCAAQAPVIASRCAQLIPADELRATLGAGMVAIAPQPRDPKVTECVWSRAGGATISLQFFDRKTIEASPVTHTLDGFYEMIVSTGEEAVGKKRDPVVGVEPRAATVQGQVQLMLVVQRTDGVVRLLLGKLTRAQTIALARAVAGT